MGQIIAALDLGSSKSIALILEKESLSKHSVLLSETCDSKKAMRRGRIYNYVEASNIVSELMKALNNNPDLKVEKIYVGIGGQSLHTKLYSVSKLIENGTITTALLNSLRDEALKYQPELEDNLGICSWEYYVDGKLNNSPNGVIASLIEAKFQLAVGNPCLKRNLESLLRKKEISVAGYFISPLATAEAVLTRDEKESGCALVELGEGLTYISIYKNRELKYMITIPVGGLAITKDICVQNVKEDEAEALKIKYGDMLNEYADNEEVPVNEENPSRKINLKKMNQIIEGRVNEIVKNISHQIQVSGYSQALNAGIVITGGGALLRNLPQYIKEQTGKEVRLAQPKMWEDKKETYLSPADSCVAGLAILGKENCVKDMRPKVELPPLFTDVEVVIAPPTPPRPPKKKIWERVIRKIDDGMNNAGATLFNNEDLNKAKKQ